MTDRYTLLAPAGVTPQVITETVFELHRLYGWVPEAVHVVTTTTGRAAVRARLLNEAGHKDHRGQPLAPADAWACLCRDVLRVPEPPALEVHVVRRDDAEIDDIRHPADDRAFAEACYGLVARLTGEGRSRLVGSISGGRKSMSAHVMNAFSALARAQDRLCHALVAPPSLESKHDFFYPTDLAAQQVRLVDLGFPRLRPVLLRGVLGGRVPGGFGELLEAVRPYLLAEQRPATAELVLGDRHALLRLSDEHGDELGKVRLSETRAATLLVFADRLCVHPAGIPVGTLFEEARTRPAAAEHPVHRARTFVTKLMNDRDCTPWTDVSDVSKSLNELGKALKQSPIAARFFALGSAYDGRYGWPETPPCPLRVRMAPALRPSQDHIEAEWTTHFPNLSYDWL